MEHAGDGPDPALYPRRSERCPGRARASTNSELLAETEAAMRVDDGVGGSTLWFPEGDALSALAGVDAGLWWRGSGEFAHHVAFDDARIRLEIVDASTNDDPRGVTIKRHPTWGDASDLISVLDVQPLGDGRYESRVRVDHVRPVVEGSQMLGQAIVAAGREVPGRRAVSATMIFLRAADARVPLTFAFDEVFGGRSMTTLAVRVTQAQRLCATGILLLDATAADTIRHSVEPPRVVGPYDSTPYDMGVTGRDVRFVDGTYTGDPDAPVGPPVIDAWVRFRDVPADPSLHAGLLAQFCGHVPIAAALRPHSGIGQDQAHRTISTAINAISLSLHREIRADEWMLYHHLSTFAGDGMTHAECRVHNEDGQLLASFTVDAMVRPFVDASGPVDPRTAL